MAAVLACLSSAALIAPAPSLAAGPLDPVVTITGGPNGATTDRTPTFTFTSADTNTFECRIDGGSFTSCASPFTSGQLSFGNHTFQVRGIGLGLFIGQPSSRSFTVVDPGGDPQPGDTSPPNTTITAGPADKSTVHTSTVTFEFASNEGDATFECMLDTVRGNFAPCQTPLVLRDLPDGPHSVLVRAVDPAGNKDQTPEFRSFVVDTAPDGPMCLGAPVTIMGTESSEEITGTDGADVIYGLGGDDVIGGGLGGDRICAGDGDDGVSGGEGADKIALGPGNDRVNGGKGSDDLGGGPGTDKIAGAGGGDRIGGSTGGDALSGDTGKDMLNGGTGPDRCDGGAGHDADKKCERTIGVP